MPAAILDVLAALLASFVLSSPAASSPPDVSRLQTARNVGFAALEEGNLVEAAKRFGEVRRLAASEPLGWANGAVAALRGKDLPLAKTLMAEALRLAPSDPGVLALEGTLREAAGETDAAIEAFERAAAANPRDLAARWAAARLLSEKSGGHPRAIALVRAALEQSPSNEFLLLRLSDLLRQEGDRPGAAAALRKAVDASRGSTTDDAKLEKYAGEATAALGSGDSDAASLKSRLVENLLRVTPRYQQARHDVDPGVLGLPLEDWTPSFAARVRGAFREAGIPLRFVPFRAAALSSVTGASSVRVAGASGRDLVVAGSQGIARLSAAASYAAAPPIPASGPAATVAVADVANSGELAFAVPGALWTAQAGGFRKTELPAGERVLALDYDSDGDLDLYVCASSGDRLMRNNLDGSFTDVTSAALPAGTASRAGAVADFDRDGDPDVVLARASGGLELLDNRRGGRFAVRSAGLPDAGRVIGVAAADVNGDGRPDLVWTTESETFVALNRGDGTFLPARSLAGGGTPLLLDFDNDGALDLLVAGPKGSTLYRNDGAGLLTPVAASLPPAIDAEAVDLDGDGDLDLVLVTPDGRLAAFENQGGNANGWLDVALEGLPTGSAKVNRLGYGSEIEVRAGELYVFRTASRPVTRLGLGARRKADVLRILWTNGIPQNALDPPVRTLLREVQQLKGSCPFLYAFDGERWRFVTDVLGRSPVGLLYDGVHQAAADTREWIVIPGEALRPSRGRLVLDVTEELWEAAFLDLARLEAVDHPGGVEIVANERMVPPPFPEKRLFAASKTRVPRALDETGRDRTAEIARRDGVYLGGFAKTRYQGVVGPHALTLDLSEARTARRVMLYLTGWILYTDTSINVSLAQGQKPERPAPPVLAIPDGRGGWKNAPIAFGYPAGKTKTMAIDLSDVLDRRDPRVRIETNLAIFWDRIVYTADDPEVAVRRHALPLTGARLFFRGFSRRVEESPGGPDVFLHDDVETAPRWADMTGLYTRFGDVTPLLAEADDRYVIMKGGDAVRLEFDAAALPALPPGWSRDWVLVLDGWDKDADKNTVAGQTVEPLPFHGMDDGRYGLDQTYPDDAAHREFRAQYLTRPGGPEAFLGALAKGRSGKGGD